MSRHFQLFGVALVGLAMVAGGIVWSRIPLERPLSDPSNIDQVELGRAVYGRDCARCHGDDLKGEFGWLKEEHGGDLSDDEIELLLQSVGDAAPAHDGSGMTWRHDDEVLFDIIKDGPAIALSKPTSRMPGFGERLEDNEIWALVAFMKSNWRYDESNAQ